MVITWQRFYVLQYVETLVNCKNLVLRTDLVAIIIQLAKMKLKFKQRDFISGPLDQL
jgi:hypothetical protein